MNKPAQTAVGMAGVLEGVPSTLVHLGHGFLGTGIIAFLLFLPHSESIKNIGVVLGLLGLLLLVVGRQVPRPPLFWPLAGFLAIAFLVTPTALEPWQSLRGAWDVLRFSLTYVMIYTFCQTPRKVGWVVALMLAASVLGMGVGLLDYALGEVHFERLQIRSLGYPNQTATCLTMYLGLVLGLLAFGKLPRWQRVGLALLTGLILVGILLTYSRGAWVALSAVGGVLLVLLLRERRLGPAALVVTLAALLIGLALLHPGLRQRLDTLTEPTETVQMLQRFETWQSSLAVIRDHPVLGIGLKNMKNIDFERYGFPDKPPHAHNQFLITTMEMGLVGLLGLLGVLGAYGGLMLRMLPRSGDPHGPYWFASVAAGITWVAVGIVNLSYQAEPAMLFWTLTALAMVSRPVTQQAAQGAASS